MKIHIASKSYTDITDQYESKRPNVQELSLEQAAIAVIAVATGNDMGEIYAGYPNSIGDLGKLLSEKIYNQSLSAVISDDCEIVVYKKFHLFAHCVFVSPTEVIDSRHSSNIGTLERPTYEIKGKKVDYEVGYRGSVLDLFAQLHAVNHQVPTPRWFTSESGVESTSLVIHRALRSRQGYGALRLHPDDAKQIEDALFAVGLRGMIRPEEYHVTLMYDAQNPMIDKDTPENVEYRARVGELTIYGDAGSRWESIVLKLDSPDLLNRHNFLLRKGYRHSYPTFNPHLSLKYMPDEGDLEKIKGALDQGMFPTNIRLIDEYWERVVGD